MAYYTPDGVAIAIIHEGQRRGVSPKGICIALSTGLVESDLYMHANEGDPETLNYPHDKISKDYDSSGIFQQRPVWWGTPNHRMDVAYSAGLFYDALSSHNYDTDAHSPGWYAYQVQDCAEEYAYRYDERYAEACELYDRLSWEVCPAQPGTCNVAGTIGPMVSPSGVAHELVGERVLDGYDSSIVPQETGYWCGPAATQVVLNEAGIYVSEQQLANEMGTDSNGTDYIGIIENVLDKYVGDIYATVDIPQDPMSDEQKERLWDDILRSVDGGWGIVMNWVAPPGNKPIGIKGSETPHYGGGTTYHYVACMGYDDNPNQRACWIADSGFYPFEYWCSFDQVATLIPPKGYTYAAVEPPPGEGDIDMANIPQEQWDRLLADVADIRTQLRGPHDQGWEQLGKNAEGHNLSVVDALGSVKSTVEGQPPPFQRAQSTRLPRQGKERQRKNTPS
jgi:Peptidase_C39 like family